MSRAASGFVPVGELAAAVGVTYKPVKRYMRELGIASVRREDKDAAVALLLEQRDKTARGCRKKSGETRRKKAGGACSPAPAPAPDGGFGWRVSLLGRFGWLVVRCGTRLEMEAWAGVFARNGFEAQVRENIIGSVMGPDGKNNAAGPE